MKTKIGFLLCILLAAFYCGGQTTVYGNVHAFRELNLNNIEVKSKRAKTITKTDSFGNFNIVCKKNDKLKFVGNGFEKTIVRTKGKDAIFVKMILKAGLKNENLAIESGHVSKTRLLFSISHFSIYNKPQQNEPKNFLLFPKINENEEFGHQSYYYNQLAKQNQKNESFIQKYTQK